MKEAPLKSEKAAKSNCCDKVNPKDFVKRTKIAVKVKVNNLKEKVF